MMGTSRMLARAGREMLNWNSSDTEEVPLCVDHRV